MSPSLFLAHFIGGAIGSSLLLSLAIIIGTFILEDPTTIIVGVLAADGVIAVPLALLSLYAGIIIGDIGLYCLGWLASTHPRLARYVDHDFIAPFRAWLESRYILTIFSARFIPGSRLPTYTASGFFRSPLSTFVGTAVVATSVWTTILFSLSYWFGSFSSEWLGSVRWGIAAALVAALFLVARHNLVKQRVDTGAGIRTP
ncbi:MAG TPA: VTT domain-containing protein [Candidatus Paceibacterota bacterium]|nr:VTT domain-containing protein [Candidatus Paceibacterota bacterium]